jgi:hypothetical protein
MVTTEATTHTFSFNPRYKKQILDLDKHREPGYPSFLTLELLPEDGEPVWATIWYIGKPESRDNRYHVQLAGESKVLLAMVRDNNINISIEGQHDDRT